MVERTTQTRYCRPERHRLIVGYPLRSCETLHAFAFHHRIEEFWKLLKGTLHLDDMKFQEREGAYVCVGLNIMGYIVVNMVKQRLRKRRCFNNVTINQLVEFCPKFVDIRKVFKEHFHAIIPDNYNLENALA